MDYEDLEPPSWMVWDEGLKRTTTLIIVPSLIQVDSPAFNEAFVPPAEAFIKQVGGQDGAVIFPVSFQRTGPMSDSRRFGAGLYAMLSKIHRGEVTYPCGSAKKPNAIFLDGTFDPLGGQAAVGSLLGFAATMEPATTPEARPTLTATYLPSTAFGSFAHTTKLGSPPQPPPASLLSGDLTFLDIPPGDTSQQQVMDMIGGHIAAHPPVLDPSQGSSLASLAGFRRSRGGTQRVGLAARATGFDPRQHSPHEPITHRRPLR